MSTQPRLQPSRRTVLRTAVWTAPAVSIAVAAPAFAASGDSGTASGSLTRDSKKGLTFTVSFRNTGVRAYALTVVLTHKTGSQTLTRVGAVPRNGLVQFPTAAETGSNDDDQTITLRYYAGSVMATNLLGTLTFLDVDASSTRTGTWT